MLAQKAYIEERKKNLQKKVTSSDDRAGDLWGSSLMLYSLSYLGIACKT